MRFIFAALVMVICSSAAIAEQGRLVDESETGIVFGDQDCSIETRDASRPRFSVETFDYLYATVTITTTCVTRDGLTFRMSGEDSVPFLAVRFDWRDQAWYKGDALIAKRRGSLVEPNSEFDFTVWLDGQDTHTAFRVEVREKQETKNH